eukprot:3374427-Lingulodinium_polyedra.AAC.1
MPASFSAPAARKGERERSRGPGASSARAAGAAGSGGGARGLVAARRPAPTPVAGRSLGGGSQGSTLPVPLFSHSSSA